MSGQKRQFPYHTSVPEVELKRQNVAAGYERPQPATFEAPTIAADVVEVCCCYWPSLLTADAYQNVVLISYQSICRRDQQISRPGQSLRSR